ncbi:MAG: signal peptidase I [Lachnospiraceae bacterium]
MRKKTSALLEYGLYLLILLFVLFIVPKFLMEKVLVDGDSMENSLFDGEHILIEKVSRYFDGPDRFDIVVFHKQKGTIERTYVKRIIGLPGETVQIVGDTILIDGEPLEENFGKDPIIRAGLAAEPVVLGEDEYFVLGDNRTVSADSRSSQVGIVKKSELDGVAFFRIYPFGRFGGIK